MKSKLWLCFVSLTIAVTSFAKTAYPEVENKGKLFLYWGWNGASYTDSDITFKGKDYDFTLKNVKATDRQSDFSFSKYFGLTSFTIPQYNYRMGYFLSNNYTISFGLDHMKYVMVNDQTVTIEGEIKDNYGENNGDYKNGATKKLDAKFLRFEHTDGLNYASLEFSRFDNVSRFIGINPAHFQINITEGLGIGLLIPKTNTKLLSKERYDEFHLAGYGVSARVALDLTFFEHFFIMGQLKGGFIHMPSIRITKDDAESASQKFGFFQKAIIFGGRFAI